MANISSLFLVNLVVFFSFFSMQDSGNFACFGPQAGSNNAELSSLKLLHNTLELVRYRLGGNWGKLEILSRENFPRIFLHNVA